MSDMLNEKFEEFLSGQQVVMEAGADPMPRVSASVIPGTCLLYPSPSPRDS